MNGGFGYRQKRQVREEVHHSRLMSSLATELTTVSQQTVLNDHSFKSKTEERFKQEAVTAEPYPMPPVISKRRL